MKIILPLCCVAALTAGVGSVSAAAAKGSAKPGDYKGAAKTAIPQNSFGVYSYDEAQKEAAKKKKALAFIVTDERADDPAVKAAGAKAFWAIEDDAVVLVLRASTAAEWKRLPPNIVAVLTSPDIGKEYPRLVVASEDAGMLLAGMNSSTVIGLDQKKFDKFGKELRKLNAAKAASEDYPPPNPAPAKAPATPPGTTVKPAEKPGAPPGTPAKPTAVTPPAPAPAPVPSGPVVVKNPQAEDWTNADGKTIRAMVVEIDAEALTFQMPDGSKVIYEISKLSDASKKRAADLKAANAK